MKFDSFMLDFSDKLDHKGYLHFDMLISRVGLHDGVDDDGKIIPIMRLPKELFAEKSLNSLRNIVITNDHPFENNKPVFLDSRNTEYYQVGYGTDTIDIVDDYQIQGSGIITNAEVIEQIRNGKKQGISTGYQAATVHAPGSLTDSKGIKHDYLYHYMNILYNHICVTNFPRILGMGLKFDSVGNLKNSLEKLMKLKFDGHTYEVPDEVGAKFDSIKQELEEYQKNSNKTLGQANVLLLENESLKKEIESLKVKVEESLNPKKLDSIVNERLELISKVKPVLGDKFKFDSLTNENIKVEYLKSRYDSFSSEGKTKEFIDGCFFTAINQNVEGKAPLSKDDKSALKTISDPKTDSSSINLDDLASQSFDKIKQMSQGGN